MHKLSLSLIILGLLLLVTAFISYRNNQGTLPGPCSGPLCHVVVPDNRAGTNII